MYSVDTDRLKELSPDLIVTQTQCDVCAVSEEQLASALNILSAGTTELFSFSPATFKDVLDQALALGVKLEQTEAAMEFLSQKEHDLHRLKQALRRCAPPTVLAIEWMEPVMVAGHWTPDLITHAGGVPLLTASGEASRYISWEAVSDADPDVICLIPCGFDLGQIRGNIDQLIDHPEWQDLRAVQNGDVYAFNGDAYFNRPGPRLYRSIELLALALHRDHVRDLVSSPSSNEMARIHSRSFSTN